METGSSAPFSIVVEAKDRQTAAGRKSISDSLDRAMHERKAKAGLYVSKTLEGLGRDVGEWTEGSTGRGPYVACSHLHLLTALRFLVVQRNLLELRTTSPDVDTVQIESQVQRIRISLERIRTINRKVGDVRSSAADIQDEAEQLRDEIKDGLTSIEDGIGRATMRSASAKKAASGAK